MNEASVASEWARQLRLLLPGAEVIKHRDASMIGLPDYSITWNKKIAWVETKLWVPTKGWDGSICSVPVEKIVASEKMTQFNKVLALSRQAHWAGYIIWVKKSKMVLTWRPPGPIVASGFSPTTRDSAVTFSQMMRNL